MLQQTDFCTFQNIKYDFPEKYKYPEKKINAVKFEENA
jgi:hypothetical protein